MRILANILLLVAALGTAAFLFSTRKIQSPDLKQPIIPLVTPYVIEPVTLQGSTTLTSWLQPSKQARLHFEVTGQLLKRRIEPGQKVNKGDLLLEIDPSRYQQQVDRNQASLELERITNRQNRDLLKLAEEGVMLQSREVDRLKRLRKTQLVSDSSLEQAKRQLLQKKTDFARLKYTVEMAASREKEAQTRLAMAQLDLAKCRLVAPFSGTIDEISVETGEFVTQGQQVLTLIDLDPLEVRLEVSTEVAKHLALGQSVEVRAGQSALNGHLIAIEQDPDPTTLTHSLTVSVHAQDMMPGQRVEVTLPLGKYRNTLAIPETAILYESGLPYVFRITGDTLEKIQVQASERIRSQRIIEAGLHPGEQIVADNVSAMSPGLKVRLRNQGL